MVNWTDEQLAAIEARNTGIIVSAAAGSGKTAVLVERLTRILADKDDRTPADRLVVVTFTNDAAAQMKKRLSDALSKKIADDPENDWLRGQQMLLQTAKISTIHSFCFDLIRENIQTLDIPSGFRVLDEAEESLLVRRAADNTFEILYKKKPELIEKLSDFFSGSARSDEAFEETVIELHRFLVSIPFYKYWLREQVRYYYAAPDLKDGSLAKIYLKYIRSEYVRMLNTAAYANSLSVSELGGPVPAIEHDIKQLQTLIADLDDETKVWDERVPKYDFIFDKFDAPKLSKEEKGTKDNPSPKALMRESIKNLRDKGYKAGYEKIRKKICSEAEINADYKKHAEILRSIVKVINIFDKELDSLKAEKNALSFSDAEQLAVRLLADRDKKTGCISKTPLAKELSDYYRVIMVDEFQDTNNTQDLIFKMLSKDGTAEKGGTDLFTVGDAKQSIYRFRLADLQLFRDALAQAQDYTGADFSGTNAKILLNKNFRSSKDVIDFVNYCFRLLMSGETGGVDYTASEELVYGADYPDADRSTQIIAVPVEDDPSSGNTGGGSSDDGEWEDDADTAVYEARTAAEKIKAMLDEGKKVLENGEERPCEPKDFCILMRNKKNFDTFVKELAALGIEAYSEEPEGYLLSREISVLTSLLAVIDNPMQDIPLTAVLMSPMFMLSADDMAQLACIKRRKEYCMDGQKYTVSGKKYFTLIRSITDGDGTAEETEPDKETKKGEENETEKKEYITLSHEIYDKLKKFMEIFNKLRYCAASQLPGRLIRTIYDSSDFLSAVQVFKDGSRKRANLRLLLSLAESYEKNSAGGLSGFVRYLDSIVKRGGDLKQAGAGSKSGNAVSVMTMHRSKGLEYPFVFICGTSAKFNTMDLNKRVQINNKYGIGMKIQDRNELRLYNSFPMDAIREINRSEMKSEELRLLYVALTRAKEQLFIIIPGTAKVKDRIFKRKVEMAYSDKVNASAADSMAEWIAMVMFHHPAGDWFRGDETIQAQSGVKIQVEIYKPRRQIEEDSVKTETASSNIDTVNELKRMFSYTYKNDELTNSPAKITVTEIVTRQKEEQLKLDIPKFVIETGELSSAQKGTAMHTFMQYADFDEAERDPEKEADALAEKGLLSPEERKSLDIGKLNGFFRSELYERIRKADKVYREKKFMVKKSVISLDDKELKEYNEDSMIQGIADCLFEENGKLVLVDYKTDRDVTDGQLRKKHNLQLRLYSQALTAMMEKEVQEAYLYSFFLGKAVPVDLQKCPEKRTDE